MPTLPVFSELDKKERIDLVISLIVIVFAGISILYFSFPSIFGEYENVIAPAAIVKKETKEFDFILFKKDTYFKLENHRPESEYIYSDTKNVTKQHTYTTIDNSLQTSSKMDAEETNIPSQNVEQQHKEELIKKDENQNVADNPILSDTINNDIEKNHETKEDSFMRILKDFQKKNYETKGIDYKNTDEIAEQKEIEYTSEDCVIVIGTFKNQENIRKIKKSLASKKYKIFTTQYKQYTRIGIYQKCKSNRIQKVLKDIRHQYAKDALIVPIGELK